MWQNHIVPFFTDNPSMTVFLTLCLGFVGGRFRYKIFTLGTVTSVLMAGVVLGILLPEVRIQPPLKNVFFLLFLFAVGYSVGPQFFRSFRKAGLPQVAFAAMMCVLSLSVTWLCARVAGYNAGEAVGLFAGAQTCSAVIGVGQETIMGLNASEAARQSMSGIVPVMYAVTYVFGTAGTAWLVAFAGPRIMGGFEKCRHACKAEEERMGESLSDRPGYSSSLREVSFRCYRVDNDWFGTGKTVARFEEYVAGQGRRLFVDRIRHHGEIVDTPAADCMIYKDDVVVLSGRRESVIGEEAWIGEEAVDSELLDFPIRVSPTKVASKAVDGITVKELLGRPFMHGVSIRHIRRQQTIDIPVRENTVIDGGDMITLVGLPYDVATASKAIGRAANQTDATDIIFVTLGIIMGGAIGVLSFNAGNVPVSLTTSGGALIMGLVFGWWHSRRPDYGQIPTSAIWVFRELGLNMFIACVGLQCGPGFVQGFQQAGWMLLLWGAVATALPVVAGIFAARYLFRFHPGIALGCVAGTRTTTAALGAVEESLHSTVPAMGYAVTYAVGNTLLILSGVVMVILFA